jgi:hypothetical protein
MKTLFATIAKEPLEIRKLIFMHLPPAFFASLCFSGIIPEVCFDVQYVKKYKKKWEDEDDEFDPVIKNLDDNWEYLYFFNLLFSFEDSCDNLIHEMYDDLDFLKKIVKYVNINFGMSEDNMSYIAERIIDNSDYDKIDVLKLYVKYLNIDHLKELEMFEEAEEDMDKFVNVVKEEIVNRK